MAKRIQRKRTVSWRMPTGTIYVGRPTRWGNPFTFKGTAPEARHTAVAQYEDWLKQPSQTGLVDEICRELAGKDLACWCPLDKPCHADILLKVANEEST